MARRTKRRNIRYSRKRNSKKKRVSKRRQRVSKKTYKHKNMRGGAPLKYYTKKYINTYDASGVKQESEGIDRNKFIFVKMNNPLQKNIHLRDGGFRWSQCVEISKDNINWPDLWVTTYDLNRDAAQQVSSAPAPAPPAPAPAPAPAAGWMGAVAANMCDHCKAKPKRRGHPYCGRTCAKNAGALR
jgi:hypothetical protein